MAEMRKVLTKTQRELLVATQQRRQLAEQQLKVISEEADRVLALVYDAHGLPVGGNASFDEATGELVVQQPNAAEKPAAKKKDAALRVEK